MTDRKVVLEPDPVIEAFKRDIDRTMLRANLRLSREERLLEMYSALKGAMTLQEADK